MNIAEQSTKCAIESARDTEKNGADGLMLFPPMRYRADARETVTYFKEVAKEFSCGIRYEVERCKIFSEQNLVRIKYN